jgi:hypothetical protein
LAPAGTDPPGAAHPVEAAEGGFHLLGRCAFTAFELGESFMYSWQVRGVDLFWLALVGSKMADVASELFLACR